MNFRTDLAIERHEVSQHPNDGIKVEQDSIEDVKITRIIVLNENGEKQLQKPKGSYITIETPPFSNESVINPNHMNAIKDEISKLIPKEGPVLICGIGNTEITPDALGPKVASLILATRHISQELSKSIGLGTLRPVSVVTPGVLGQTGIETGEILLGIIDKIKPTAIIAIDALASRRLSRLGCTVQIADTGIIPGSGVGNARTEISKRTLGIPVIAVGVPTVVDAQTLVNDLTDSDNTVKNADLMIVTPKEIDLLIERAARLIAQSINCCLQPHIDPDDMALLVG